MARLILRPKSSRNGFRHHCTDDETRAAKKTVATTAELAEEVKISGGTEIDFKAALHWLREEWNVKRLLCEGGGELNDALFRAGLVDEINLTICPKIFGGRLAPTISDGLGCSQLAAATEFKLASIQSKNGELFTRYLRTYFRP